jgi:hypothetical protein
MKKRTILNLSKSNLQKTGMLPLSSFHLYFICILEFVNNLSQLFISKKCAYEFH